MSRDIRRYLSLSSHLVISNLFFVMASDFQRELLASDNETLNQTSTQPSVSATHSTLNTTNTEQVFQQLAQFLDNKLDQKLASFKRSFDEREDLHASQLKKLKTESKASSSFKFKGNKIQYRMIWPKTPKTKKNCEPQNVER